MRPLRPLLLLLILWISAGCNTPRPAPTAVPPKPDSQPLFEDVAQKAGVRFTHSAGAEGRFYFIESTPAGCAMFDYDNDGFLDLLLLQSGPSRKPPLDAPRPHCALYRNLGDGTFQDVTSGSGLDRDLGYAHGVAVGDYDNDGYEDLFITAYRSNHLLRNDRGTGRFMDVTAKMGLDRIHSTGYATSAAFGDYDNDGRLDLYVCYYCPWTWENDKPCKDANGRPDYCTPELYDPDTDRLYRNTGTRFIDVSQQAGITRETGRGLAVAFFDYDQDGKQDIFVANDLTPNFLWHNRGNGTFVNEALKAGCAFSDGGLVMAAMGVGVADYNRTGRDSLYVTNFSGLPNVLFQNMGGGVFLDVTANVGLNTPTLNFLAFGCEFLDYDNDGWSDLLACNGHVQLHAETKMEGVTYRQRKQLFRNREGARFEEITDLQQLGGLAEPHVGRGLAVGDFDNDGRVDALALNQNGPAQLLRNQTPNGHHWVMFKAVGTRSNRSGLHTRFTLTAGGARQSAAVRAGSSYLSASDTRVHFGLADASVINTVEIQWPSGRRETLRNLQADAIYIVTEGKGITGRQPVKGQPPR
jgi:hypothetical protein